ncbi:MAG: transposase [Bryobacteraceae bacterium]
MFYRRHLPHWFPRDKALFITWRLAGSPPPKIPDIIGKADDKKRSSAPPRGPFWLQDPRIAEIVKNALVYGETVRRLYDLYAWVIMPNHVHIILQPKSDLPKAMQWLKGRSARMANRTLGHTGLPFWQDESFDHWIRSNLELHYLIEYVEGSPVRAGFVQTASQWPWSGGADDRFSSSAVPS